jgi:hypothetical protein
VRHFSADEGWDDYDRNASWNDDRRAEMRAEQVDDRNASHHHDADRVATAREELMLQLAGVACCAVIEDETDVSDAALFGLARDGAR